MRLVILYGPPGVGKLTVAKGLAEQTGYKILHNHLTIDAVAPFFEFGSEPFMYLIRKIRLEIVSQLAKSSVKGVIQTSCFSAGKAGSVRHVEDLKTVVHASGGAVIAIQLSADQGILEKRVQSPERSKFGKLTEVDALRRALQRTDFLSPMPPHIHTASLNTSALSVNETIQGVLKCIR